MVALVMSRTTNVHALNHYVQHEQAHDDSGQRVQYMSAHGARPETFVREVLGTKRRFGKAGLKTDALHVILSASKEEQDPEDPDAGVRMLELGQAFARRSFPGRQFLSVVQKDGNSGLWHTHLVVANVAYAAVDCEVVQLVRENGDPKGKVIDRVRSVEHMAAGRALNATQSSVHRARFMLDEVLLEQGFDNKALMRERAVREVNVTKGDLERRATGRTPYRDELREVIEATAAEASDVDDFRARMGAAGVAVHERGKEKNFSYEWADREGKQRRARAGGSKGLGRAYGRQGIQEGIEARLASQKAAQAPAAAPARLSWKDRLAATVEQANAAAQPDFDVLTFANETAARHQEKTKGAPSAAAPVAAAPASAAAPTARKKTRAEIWAEEIAADIAASEIEPATESKADVREAPAAARTQPSHDEEPMLAAEPVQETRQAPQEAVHAPAAPSIEEEEEDAQERPLAALQAAPGATALTRALLDEVNAWQPAALEQLEAAEDTLAPGAAWEAALPKIDGGFLKRYGEQLAPLVLETLEARAEMKAYASAMFERYKGKSDIRANAQRARATRIRETAKAGLYRLDMVPGAPKPSAGPQEGRQVLSGPELG